MDVVNGFIPNRSKKLPEPVDPLLRIAHVVVRGEVRPLPYMAGVDLHPGQRVRVLLVSEDCAFILDADEAQMAERQLETLEVVRSNRAVGTRPPRPTRSSPFVSVRTGSIFDTNTVFAIAACFAVALILFIYGCS